MPLDFTPRLASPHGIFSQKGFLVHSNAEWRSRTGMSKGGSITKLKFVFRERSEGWWQELITKLSPTSAGQIDVEFEDELWRLNLNMDLKSSNLIWVHLDRATFYDAENFARLAHEARLIEVAEMAGNISHEITNPLTIVAARAEMLNMVLSKSADSASITMAINCAKTIIIQSQRITKIVRALRNFSRPGESDPIAETKAIQLIEEATALCSEKARLSGAKVSVVGLAENVRIKCRLVPIVQVLVNLINNALDSVEKHATPEVTIAFREKKESFDILVSDNGPGVPSELVHKIFNPFFTTKQVGRGSGLGLSLSLRIMRANGGNLFLESNVSPSCFVLQLPREVSLVASN